MAVTCHLVSTVRKQTELNVGSVHSPFYSVQAPSLGHGAARNEGLVISPSANPTQEFPHRPAPTFASWVILDHIRGTTATNSYPVLSVVYHFSH